MIVLLEKYYNNTMNKEKEIILNELKKIWFKSVILEMNY